MPVVSFRLSEEDLEKLEALGIHPGPRARELLLEELEMERFRESIRWLEEHSVTPSRPVADTIREMRESR